MADSNKSRAKKLDENGNPIPRGPKRFYIQPRVTDANGNDITDSVKVEVVASFTDARQAMLHLTTNKGVTLINFEH